MKRMYVFDTNVFQTLGNFKPKRFPTIWDRIDALVLKNDIISVKEVRNEIEFVCHFDHINEWVKRNRHIFVNPSPEECEVVADIFKTERNRGIVRRQSILKGSPVADPFLIAAAKIRRGCVVTQESFKSDGARIPTICMDLQVKCLDLDGFFEEQQLIY